MSEPESLVCPRCLPLELRVAELEGALQSMQAQHDEQAIEIAGLQMHLRRAGQAEVALRNQLKQATEEDTEDDEQIRTILRYWKRALGHPRASEKKTGKRWKVVKAALKQFSPEEILEAIDGLALLPYVGKRGRCAVGSEAQRHDELHIPLADETTMDRFRGYAQRAREAAVNETPAMFQTWARVNALNAHWEGLVLGAICRREWHDMDSVQRRELVELWREVRDAPRCEPSFVGLPVPEKGGKVIPFPKEAAA